MAKIKPETLRARIKKDIESKMNEKGLTSELYRSKLGEYMELYDQDRMLQYMADSMAAGEMNPKAYIDCLREMRQIRKAMRDTLDWMDITPTAEPPKEENYDL